jgi:putative transcriptional regulator
MKNLIKVERAKIDMTQAELADVLKVSRQTINSIELGKFVPSTVLSLKIAAYFKVKFEELFILEDKDWEIL